MRGSKQRHVIAAYHPEPPSVTGSPSRAPSARAGDDRRGGGTGAGTPLFPGESTHTSSFPRGLPRRIMIVSFGSAPSSRKGGGGRFANAGRVVRKRALVQRPPRCSCVLVSAPDSWEGGASLRHMTVLLSGIRAGPRLPRSRRFVTSPTHPYSNAPSGVRRRLSPAGEITSLQADGCEPCRQDTAPHPTTKTPHERAPAGRDGPRIGADSGAGISIFLCHGGRQHPPHVTPAKAGVHTRQTPWLRRRWISAFAGMTGVGLGCKVGKAAKPRAHAMTAISILRVPRGHGATRLCPPYFYRPKKQNNDRIEWSKAPTVHDYA